MSSPDATLGCRTPELDATLVDGGGDGENGAGGIPAGLGEEVRMFAIWEIFVMSVELELLVLIGDDLRDVFAFM